MAIKAYIGDRIVGSSTDLASYTATDGTLFITDDTLKIYLREGGQWEEINPTNSLSSLIDVDINTNTLGADHILVYNPSTTNWENKKIDDVVPSIDELGDIGDVDLTSPTNRDLLIFDGTDWVNDRIKVGDLSDTSLTSQVTGDVLVYNTTGTIWENIKLLKTSGGNTYIEDSFISEDSVTQHESALSITMSQISNFSLANENLGDLGDVTVSGPTTNHVITWDTNTNKWVNKAVASIVSDIESIGDIDDVNLTSPDDGHALIYDNTAKEWFNLKLLDSNNKIAITRLPALAITEVFPVADIAARDLLVTNSLVQEGDVAVVSDASGDTVNTLTGSASYILDDSNNWQLLKTPDVTAAGSNTHIQYNDSGLFGGSSNFTYSSGVVTISGHLQMDKNSGVSLTTLSSGESRLYTTTGTEGQNNYTRTMLRMGSTDYIVSTHIDP